jgi:ubiquinone/menaquinone biosynthesis C-methylase UbiE
MRVEDGYKESVLAHYETPQRFDNRLQLYRFAIGSHDWHQWVFQRLKLKPADRILEIGCGNGRLWESRLSDLPRETLILLSDFSLGMLREARHVMGNRPRLAYLRIDAESLPCRNGSFDVIVANHMLYHVPSISKSIREVKRSLRSGGLFYTSAPSRTHLQELKDLLLSFDETLAFPKDDVLRFCMENGTEQLEAFFERVTLSVYTNKIAVHTATPIVRYVLSLFDGNQYPDLRDRRRPFESFVQSRLEQTGTLTLTGITGLFECLRQ